MPPVKILLLTAAVGIVGANSLALSPISGAVAESFAGADAPTVMQAAAVFGLGTAGSALFLAPQVDRIGADRALFRAFYIMLAALALSAAAPALWLLTLAQGIAGIAAGIALPAAYALAAQIAPPGQQNKTIGTVLTGWTLSLVAGVTLAALIADMIHWRAVYVTMVALSGLILLALLRAGLPNHIRAGTPTTPLTALQVPGITRALLVAAAFMLAFYGFYSFLGAHMKDVLGASVAQTGLIPLSYGIGFGLAVLLDGWIDRRGAHRMSLPIFSAIALVYLLMSQAVDHLSAFIALAFIWGVVQHLGLTLIVSRMVALDPDQRGAILGLNSSITYICVFAGAIGFRPVFEAYGYAACAVLAAVSVSIAVLDALVLRTARSAA
ncbi:MFS transporter [Litoreibacter roseus]|uniref:MFS transporter n=1 Tax=Litoreibacter roseus TaxID=2601869 RepID=A0A6N6JBH4_9RHOB|nr:MFS transporter [Litoreibacter roseus]GFE63613.1 MFS transporter [Litoreibacter roseus]